MITSPNPHNYPCIYTLECFCKVTLSNLTWFVFQIQMCKTSVGYLQILPKKIHNSHHCIFISSTTQRKNTPLKHFCLSSSSQQPIYSSTIFKTKQNYYNIQATEFCFNSLDHWSKWNTLLPKVPQTLGFNKEIKRVCSKAC